MKRFLVFLVIPFLFGCEKYELETPPSLNGGKWILTDYDITVISSISPVKVIKTDTVCISSFNLQQITDNGVIMKQDYNRTAKDRRFIRGKTTWEFDSNNSQLYCDYTQMIGVPKPEPFWVNLSNYSKNMEITNTTSGSTTNYTFQANDVGYSRTLTLLSPAIVTDLYLSSGTRDKAVTVRITLHFMR